MLQVFGFKPHRVGLLEEQKVPQVLWEDLPDPLVGESDVGVEVHGVHGLERALGAGGLQRNTIRLGSQLLQLTPRSFSIHC